jgi:hypothetical protein
VDVAGAQQLSKTDASLDTIVEHPQFANLVHAAPYCIEDGNGSQAGFNKDHYLQSMKKRGEYKSAGTYFSIKLGYCPITTKKTKLNRNRKSKST